MRQAIPALLLALLFLPAAAQAQETNILSTWVQFAPGGGTVARAVVDGTACPAITTNAGTAVMTSRAAGDAKFKLVCEASLPAGTSKAELAGRPLPLPIADPQRILVLGDTGCRIKPPELQDCGDINKWPFPELAASAAKLKPDLVIDVGDYLYRESPCPTGNTGCAGTPWGDNWATWAADFFDPAKPLLATAPWVITRGNHEDCARSGAGFLRLLAPTVFDPSAACNPHLAPYAVAAGAMNLVVFDDSNAPDTSIGDVDAFAADYASLSTIAKPPLWLIMHRPIWAAAIVGPLGISAGGSATMIKAVGHGEALAPVELMLAGHIHAFEALNYQSRYHVVIPPQVVAGHGGDNLDPLPADLSDTILQGLSGVGVKDGISVGGFGFLLMTKTDAGWRIDLYKADGTTEGQCMFASGRVDCAPHAQ